jgi:hypothetical protein
VRARWRRYARSVRACSAAGEWKQRDVACAFDRLAKPALVTRAHTGHPARQNLAALLHELRQDVGALVVDKVHLLDAELADFFLAEILALAAARAARSTRAAAWTAFASRATVPTTGAAMTATGAVSATSWTAGSC